MDEQSVARIPRTEKASRQERGIEHGRQCMAAIYRIGRWTWRVPSSSDPETVYIVALKPEFCPCADFEHRGGTCKHIYAATYVRAKVATCDGCSKRFRRRELVEATEENSAFTLSVFEGERYCRSCAGHVGIQ